MDLKSAFFQNHIDYEVLPYLGIMIPFGGLRVLTRSGQVLTGQSEELDELLSKILKDELKEGIVMKIYNDLVIGGNSLEEVVPNYTPVLHKFHLANIKVEPEKTVIFPESCDIAEWIWKKGRYLDVSPHRKSSIINTKQESVTKVKHLQSFIGLYKTLHMATPTMTRILAPLEEEVAGRDSTEIINSMHSLVQRFREAKAHINNTHTLYLLTRTIS